MSWAKGKVSTTLQVQLGTHKAKKAKADTLVIPAHVHLTKPKHTEPFAIKPTTKVTAPPVTANNNSVSNKDSKNLLSDTPNIGLRFRPDLQRTLEETHPLRTAQPALDEPLIKQGDTLLWRKNGCLEITDNESGHGQTFGFSSRCAPTNRLKIEVKEIIEAIRPTYGEHAVAK